MTSAHMPGFEMRVRPRSYVMVLPVRHFRLDEARVAIESAFSEHLRMMRTQLRNTAGGLIVVSPVMSHLTYRNLQHGLGVINESEEDIYFYPIFEEEKLHLSSVALLNIMPVMRAIYKIVNESICVHSGASWNFFLPFEFASIIFGLKLGKRTVFVMDIDYRNSAWMNYRSGAWSLKSYMVCRYIYDVIRHWQLWIAARYCTLVLLKGKKLAHDFGAGRANVKPFLDASHSEKNIIDDGTLQRKLTVLRDPISPLKIVYFGRLTRYKGVDYCIRSVADAQKRGANVTLDIIGGGEQADLLHTLVRELSADGYISFHGPRKFNQAFFQELYQFHLLLAAPLSEDTPRSALDAMAAGIPYLAFDTYYYNELLESAAGRTVPWLDAGAMTEAIVDLASNRNYVERMIESAIRYARSNTQEIWLERRFAWMMATVTDGGQSSAG